MTVLLPTTLGSERPERRPTVVLVDLVRADRLPVHVTELLTAARGGGEIVAVLSTLTSPDSGILADLGRFGADRVLLPSLGATAGDAPVDPSRVLADLAVAGLTDVLAAAAASVDPELVLVSAGFEQKEAAARLAVRLHAGLITDAAGLDIGADGIVVTKSVFAAGWVTRSHPEGLGIIAVKTGAVEAAPASIPTSPTLELLAFEPEAATRAVRLVSSTPIPVSEGPVLAEAGVVVAGGRGTGGDFGPIRDLAEALGGAVGATRDCVEDGWIDHAQQVGQTGSVVSPQLFITAGISGAVQFRAGMQTSRAIVAIDLDPEAPIFEFADLGIIGDLADLVEPAAERVRELRGR